MLSDAPAGPSGGAVVCSACGAQIDPLRAGHVAIFDAAFHYFCNYSLCRARFLAAARQAPPDERTSGRGGPDLDQGRLSETARKGAAAASIATPLTEPVRGAERFLGASTVPEPMRLDEHADLIEPVVQPVLSDEMPAEGPSARREVSMLLVALTLIAAVLSLALELGENGRLVRVARVVLLLVGSLALFGGAITRRSSPAMPHWLVAVAAPLFATVVAMWALLAGSATQSARASFLAAIVVGVAALNSWLVQIVRQPVRAGRRWVQAQLNVPGRRMNEGAGPASRALSFDIQAGDTVLVEPEEIVPVDLEVLEGDVEVHPWIGATTRVRRSESDFVVAGSRVVQGQLRGRCTRVGRERALARPLLCDTRRADIHADVPKLARAIAQRWAFLIAVVAGVVFALLDWGPIDVAMVAVAVYAAVGNLVVGGLASLVVARGVQAALSRGVVYNDASAWERSAKVSGAVFCARGTLVRGEPELAEIEVISRRGSNGPTSDEVLTLAASALAAQRAPVAVALRRAARDRGLSLNAVRNPRSYPGLGVHAVAGNGEPVCVGSRGLMLQRRISVAVAEQTIYELESSGRTVVLVARAGRLCGVLALQDGLRSGARAAVQHLLDAKIEPILMSLDTRETCEALGMALDIDHLRPETFADERAAAIDRIKEAGATVAVLGHSPHDDEALLAADVSIVLSSAGRGSDDASVSLVSDDVRDAALALALAHRGRARAVLILALVLVPAAFGTLVVTAGLLPPEYAPLAQLVGAVAAVFQLRSYDRAP